MGWYNTLIGKVSGADNASAANAVVLDPAQAHLHTIMGARTEIS